MSDFWDTFLMERRKLFAPKGGAAIHLAVFGKHPGWNDHMDDLGLQTESLLLAKQILYIEGIGGQINSGEWERLSSADRLPGFQHIFVWRRGEAFLLGRMWASSDGKGRSNYPMIVCAECQGISLFSALVEVLPILAEYQGLCQQTKSADEVRTGWERAAEKLNSLAATKVEGVVAAHDGKAAFLEKLGAAGNEEMFLRILYRLDAQLTLGTDGLGGARDLADRAVRIRLPALPEWGTESLLYWNGFLTTQYNARLPILMTLPTGERWLDVLIGRPIAKDFYALLARPEVFAMASEVAYEIDEPFRREWSSLVQTMRVGSAWGGDKVSSSSGSRSWISKLLSQE